jgi:hypothetical protein
MDPDFCILLAFSIYLEHWMAHGDGIHSRYMFSDSNDDTAPKCIKDSYRNALKNEVYNSNEFDRARPGPLGTHSVRKFPSTQARRNGCSHDDIDCRGRWRNKKRIVDRYIDVRLPYADAKVAAALCVSGPIKYALMEGSGITEDWLADNVVPHILLRFPRESSRVGMTLALPLLWACMEPTMQAFVPADLRQRVRHAYEVIRQLEEGVNPVKKVLLVVYRVEDQLMIDEAGAPQQQQQPGHPGVMSAEAIPTLFAQVNSLRRQIDELRDTSQSNASALRTDMQRHFAMLNRNVRRIAIAPARPINRTGATQDGDNEPPTEGGAVPYVSTLSPTPRTLFDLWTEYEYGIGGRKPAKDFTAAERGKVKYNYHRRKVVWDAIAALVRAGHTADVAIDRIYEIYGQNQSVTAIINHMRRDRRTQGVHPNLRV